MSWVDQVHNKMVIITGDGKQYRPQWINATKSKEFNVSQHEFVDVNGTLAKRKRPKGRSYNLEIYFQGPDHLQEAAAFESSADNEREWNLIHPYYGSIFVCPLRMDIDNRDHNLTKILCPIVETITDSKPSFTIDPSDKIAFDKAAFDGVAAETFITDIVEVTPQNVNFLKSNAAKMYNLGVKVNKSAEQAEEYFNLFNKANTAISNAISGPLAAINAVKDVINYPFLFEDTVRNRVEAFVNQFNALSAQIDTLTGRSNKKIFENNASYILSAMARSSVEKGVYENRDEVIFVIAQISDAHDNYLNDLDDLQDDNGGNPDNFIPNAQLQIKLSDLIAFTVGNLFSIAKDSRQERSIYLEQDSNIILLAHRFYGLVEDDSTIDTLFKQNKFGINDLLGIEKGRRVTYYV